MPKPDRHAIKRSFAAAVPQVFREIKALLGSKGQAHYRILGDSNLMCRIKIFEQPFANILVDRSGSITFIPLPNAKDHVTFSSDDRATNDEEAALKIKTSPAEQSHLLKRQYMLTQAHVVFSRTDRELKAKRTKKLPPVAALVATA